MIGVGYEYRGLYYLSPSPPPVTCVAVDPPAILHHRLGHPSLQKLQKMVPSLAGLSFLESLANRTKKWVALKAAKEMGTEVLIQKIEKMK
ncbi:hypothetical protein LguiA_000466 [Lonicera macranthoides]